MTIINWYPGHMVKARKEIEENIKLVDIAVILLDARAPFSCRNHNLEKIARRRQIIMVLNKMDVADPNCTSKYLARIRQEGVLAAAMDSVSGKGSREILNLIAQAFKNQAEDMLRRGRRVRATRVMVIGVPNVGKSTFLNSLVGKKIAVTGAKPGVTRGKQWVRLRDDIELMDTPGLMWPKIEDERQGLKLALLDIVGEKAYNEYEVALYLIDEMVAEHPHLLQEKFRLLNLEGCNEEILQNIARSRGHLLKGGELDLEKTCKMLLQEFRKGGLGRISLD